MQDFVVNDDWRASRSIGFDATEREDLTVTVGVIHIPYWQILSRVS
jgi:hypothetical protein